MNNNECTTVWYLPTDKSNTPSQ